MGSRRLQFFAIPRDIYIRVDRDWRVRRYANILFKFKCSVLAAACAPRCARAAGVAILLFIYVEIFTSPKRLDTSLLIFQMQISHFTIANIIITLFTLVEYQRAHAPFRCRASMRPFAYRFIFFILYFILLCLYLFLFFDFILILCFVV